MINEIYRTIADASKRGAPDHEIAAELIAKLKSHLSGVFMARPPEREVDVCRRLGVSASKFRRRLRRWKRLGRRVDEERGPSGRLVWMISSPELDAYLLAGGVRSSMIMIMLPRAQVEAGLKDLQASCPCSNCWIHAKVVEALGNRKVHEASEKASKIIDLAPSKRQKSRAGILKRNSA